MSALGPTENGYVQLSELTALLGALKVIPAPTPPAFSGVVTIPTITTGKILQNTESRPLCVCMYGPSTGGGSCQVNVSPNANLNPANLVFNDAGVPSGENRTVQFIVPAGWYYQVVWASRGLYLGTALA